MTPFITNMIPSDKTDHESPMYQQLQRLIEPKPSQVEVIRSSKALYLHDLN